MLRARDTHSDFSLVLRRADERCLQKVRQHGGQEVWMPVRTGATRIRDFLKDILAVNHAKGILVSCRHGQSVNRCALPGQNQ